jgi:hypothetical protein
VICSAHATCHDICKKGPSTFSIAEEEIRERFTRDGAAAKDGGRVAVRRPSG